LLFNSIFQLFATGVGKVASRIALFFSTMWVYFLVLAGLVMLRSAAALFPPSPLLYPCRIIFANYYVHPHSRMSLGKTPVFTLAPAEASYTAPSCTHVAPLLARH
jgi:hypothetical protein